MKKTFYLFNPGILERKDNTLKFTPCTEEGEDTPVTSQPRYLPVEDISEFYVFGSLRANSALFNFLGQKDIAVHFSIIMRTARDPSCRETACFPVECCWHRPPIIRTLRKECVLLRSLLKERLII